MKKDYFKRSKKQEIILYILFYGQKINKKIQIKIYNNKY